jgi:hypothetical protein
MFIVAVFAQGPTLHQAKESAARRSTTIPVEGSLRRHLTYAELPITFSTGSSHLNILHHRLSTNATVNRMNERKTSFSKPFPTGIAAATVCKGIISISSYLSFEIL